jgi:hypothetical protein
VGNPDTARPRPLPPWWQLPQAGDSDTPACAQRAHVRRNGRTVAAMKDTTTPPRIKHSSWRIAADVADQLGEAVDEIHFSTRAPKHAVLSAFVAAGLTHRAEIEAQFATGGESS